MYIIQPEHLKYMYVQNAPVTVISLITLHAHASKWNFDANLMASTIVHVYANEASC